MHRDDLVAALRLAVEPGELDGRLVRLGAAVAEEALAAEVGPLGERLGQQRLRLGVPGVRDVDERRDLLLHGLRPRAAGSGREARSPSRGRNRDSGSPPRPRPTSLRREPGRPGSGCNSAIRYFFARPMTCSLESVSVVMFGKKGERGWGLTREAERGHREIAVPVNVSWRNTSRSEYGTRPSRMRAASRRPRALRSTPRPSAPSRRR